MPERLSQLAMMPPPQPAMPPENSVRGPEPFAANCMHARKRQVRVGLAFREHMACADKT